MSDKEQEDYKKHVTELYRVTPNYKVVLTASGMSPWADLAYTDAASPILKMKDMFTIGDLKWHEPYWIRDIGYLLIKHQAISRPKELSTIIETCLQMGVVKSLDATKCRLSFTDKLTLKLGSAPRGRGRQLGANGRLYSASSKGKGKGKGKG